MKNHKGQSGEFRRKEVEGKAITDKELALPRVDEMSDKQHEAFG